MKCHLFFFILWLGSISASAQLTPIYFDGDKITAKKERATSYAVYGKLSDQDLWVFKRYDLDNNLVQTGSYKDETLSVPHGKFVFYMDTENLMIAIKLTLK